MLYGTGLRISELVGLSLADLDLEDGLLRAFGKGAKERIVPLGRFAPRRLRGWLGARRPPEVEPERWARRDDAEALFLNTRGGRLSRQGAWGVVRKYGEQVGLGGRLTPHVLRHSCATHMLDHGADIRTVQELLGHASISTTQLYTLVSTERLWAVYRAAHPRADGIRPLTGPHRSRLRRRVPSSLAAMSDIEASDLPRRRWDASATTCAPAREPDQRAATAALDFDENFADSGQVAAEQGENLTLGGLASAISSTRSRPRSPASTTAPTAHCEVCGEPIPAARLEAMPAARICIDHA